MLLKDFYKKLPKKFSNYEFSGISFDSRSLKKNDIFFAIKGNKLDGNNFIKQAIHNGSKIIISESCKQGIFNKVLFLKNKNPRKKLSEFASKLFYKKPKKLIAVTGTNGKSSIAGFYYQILKINNKKVSSIGTLGVNGVKFKSKNFNTTADPIYLNGLLSYLAKKKIDYVILEASSHGLKQNRLDGLKFDIGIFTNLSRDHLDYHKTYKDYLNSKLILFKKLMKRKSDVIYDLDSGISKKLNLISLEKKLKQNVIGSKSKEFKIISHNYFNLKQKVKFTYKKNFYEFKTSLIGKIQIKNLIFSILAAHKSGLTLNKILNSIQKIKPIKGRIEKIGNLKNNGIVILDFAHTPEALKTCLLNIKEQFHLRKISLVFGCGGDRDKPKRKMMGKIANLYCDKIYLTDDNPRSERPFIIRKEIKKYISNSKLCEVPSRSKAIKQAIKELKSNEILIVAGKGHENYQEYKTKKYFSDTNCILKSIKKKNFELSNDWKNNILSEILKKKISKKIKIRNSEIHTKNIKKNDIFFGLKGRKTNGSLYSKKAIQKGASIAVINKKVSYMGKKIIKQKNVIKTLSDFAKSIRSSSTINAVCITGSSGKTSVKEILGQTLSKISKTDFSNKSFNNKIGVPLSLAKINQNSEFGVFEVGMDKKGEIDELSKIIKPEVGLITNISYAHAKNFKSLKAIAEAKSELINNIKTNGYMILNSNDNFYNYFKLKAKKRKLNVISFGNKSFSNIKFLNIKKFINNSILNIELNKKKYTFKISKEIENYIENILSTISVISIYFEIDKLDKNIFLNLKPQQGRGDISKIKIGNKKITLIDESYNSNPSSLKFAINNFENINVNSSKKKVLLGDMLELGKFSKQLHQEAARHINSKNIGKLYAFGKHIQFTFNKIRPQKKGKYFKSKNEMINFFNEGLDDGDYLMIKGSNSTGLNDLSIKLKNGSINAL